MRATRLLLAVSALALSAALGFVYWLAVRVPSLPDPTPDGAGLGFWEAVQWDRAPGDPDVDQEPELNQWIGGVVAGGPGYVAHGLDEDRYPDGIGSGFAIWVSEDGREWREVEFEPQTFRRPASVDALAAGPHGIVAVGGTCCIVNASGGTEYRPTRWFSLDGETWEAVPGPEGALEGGLVTRIAAGPSGFVQVGQLQEHPAVWSSPDGRTWTPHILSPPGSESGLITDVAAYSEGYAAVGYVTRQEGFVGAVWLSRDGGAWRVVDVDETARTGDAMQLWEVVSFSGGLFVSGQRILPPEEVRCEQGGGPFNRRNCVGSEPTYLRSEDGESWEVITSLDPTAVPAGQPIGFTALAAGGPGLVALREGFKIDAALWTSPDGVTWHRTMPLRQLGEDESVYDLVVEGERAIAVGQSNDNGGVWIITASHP